MREQLSLWLDRGFAVDLFSDGARFAPIEDKRGVRVSVGAAYTDASHFHFFFPLDTLRDAGAGGVVELGSVRD